MTLEKWIIQPGESRVIDIADVRTLKVGLVGGQVDIVGHDEPGARIEVHGVSVKDLRIEVSDDAVEIDHAQLRWDNFLEVFRNFGAGGPKAEVSIAVPRAVLLTLGVVSASALVAGLTRDAKVSTVSGDVIVDGLTGDLSVNAVSGDVQVRGLTGDVNANTVSGDVAVIGTIRKASADTVSGAVLIDTEGPAQSVNINSISGNATVRLDDGLAANYVARSVGGRIRIDGVSHGGTPPLSYTGSTGELSGSFLDLRSNTVSGDLTVLRRAGSTPASTESVAEPLPVDEEVSFEAAAAAETGPAAETGTSGETGTADEDVEPRS